MLFSVALYLFTNTSEDIVYNGEDELYISISSDKRSTRGVDFKRGGVGHHGYSRASYINTP